LPKSEKERRTLFAEIKRRRSGKPPKMFTSMTVKEMEAKARQKVHKKKK